MIKTKTENINVMKGASARVLVITDALSKQPYDKGDVMSRPAYELFLKEAERNGFREEDFVFVTPCPPIPIELEGSESKIVKYITEYREEFLGVLEQVKYTCLAVLTLGKIGNRQLMGKAVQITKARGTFCTTTATGTIPVLPLLGPFHVLRRPELREIYDSDFRQLAALRNASWSLESLMDESGTEGYKWTKDITHLLNSPPKGITVDCETLGLDWHSPDFRILTIAITNRKGVSYVMPVDVAYARDTNLHGVQTPEWMKNLTEQDVESIKYQIRTLLADPNIPVSGHNLKYDIHALSTVDIEVSNWFLDTMQLAFAVDENMTSKSLDDCARRWVPTHAGYADSFNKKTDKSRMDLVGHDEMLEYAGGDTDVTYRLTQALLPLAKEDAENYECFVKVQMPALRTFVAMERTGVRIDTEALEELGRVLDQRSTDLHAELLSEVPEPVLREFEGDWNFGSAKFLIACLFGPNAIRDPESGKRLKPIKFTASTEKMPPSERVPSTSIKDHLPYFEHVPFVRKLMEYSKLQKVRSTYVGRPESHTDKQVKRLISGSYPKVVVDILQSNGIVLPKIKSERSRVKVLPEPVEVAVGEKTILVDQFGNIKSRIKTPCAGFWQYLGSGDNLIHTSFVLHATNTGRTASRKPNMQNTPKRGDMAKSFRKIFLPPIEGWKFLELDYSQVELRVAAWMANEKNMIQIYKDGGDIHSSTAAAVTNIPIRDFLLGRKDNRLLVELDGVYPSVTKYLQTLSAEKKSRMTIKEYFDLLRYQAKAVNFGYLYGMWWKGFKVYAKTDYGIDYTDQEAEATRVRFFKNYPSLERWHKSMKAKANQDGYVRALHGALRRLPNVESFDESIIGGAERQAVNAPVQRFASDLGLIAVSRLFRDAPKDMIRPVLFIHDAIVPCVHPDYVEEAASAIKYYMENPPLESWFGIRPPFPLTADVSWGDNLGEMQELEGVVAKKPSWFQSGEECPSQDPEMLKAWAIKKKRGIIVTD